MRADRASWLWPVALMVSAIALATAIALNGIYRAAGVGPGETYYACLYAGSLTQVGTSEPPNCGRGSVISWGAPGPAGDSSVAMWAVVDEDGTLDRGSGVESATRLETAGAYEVIFVRDVSECAFIATTGDTGTGTPWPAIAGVASRVGKPNGVFVRTYYGDDVPVDSGFHLAVLCDDEGENQDI